MLGRQLRVHLVTRLAEADGTEPAVVLGQLLLHDVGLDRHAQVVRLPRQVGRSMVIHPVLPETFVAQVAPQDRRHAQLVRIVERLGYLHELAAALLRPEIDRSPHGGGAHVPGIAHGAEHHLVIGVGVGEQLVVVELDDERYLVCISACHGAQHAEGRSHGVTAALDGQPDDILRVEIGRVRGERRPGGVFDALIYGQDRDIARTGQAPVGEDPLQAAERPDVTVGFDPDLVDRIGCGQVKLALVDRPAHMGKVVFGLLPENFNGFHNFTILSDSSLFTAIRVPNTPGAPRQNESRPAGRLISWCCGTRWEIHPYAS